MDAIIQAHEAMKPIAERLGMHPPTPRLAGFTYPHVASLGAVVNFPHNSEPKPDTIISRPEEIDSLREPKDYLAAPLIQTRLKTLDRLIARCPNAVRSIGHIFEGPVTTAALILGEAFFTLPYDDPKRAHRLLSFATTSALNYARVISRHFGQELKPGPFSFPDDFSGLFPPPVFEEFVAPYWERYCTELRHSTSRSVHSELIRPEHLPILKKLGIDTFDPGMDRYLTPELLRDQCPCAFHTSISPWSIRDLSGDELEALYVRHARCGPALVKFSIDCISSEPKIARLLKVARQSADSSYLLSDIRFT